MIKFLFKMIIVFIIALAAVIYHNTDAGRDMERRIASELTLSNLAIRAEQLFDKAVYFLSLKGMEYKAKSENALKESLKVKAYGKKNKEPAPVVLEAPRIERKLAAPKIIEKKTIEPPVKKEKIDDEDRMRLIQIIEAE